MWWAFRPLSAYLAVARRTMLKRVPLLLQDPVLSLRRNRLKRYSTTLLLFLLAVTCAFPLASLAQRKARKPAAVKPTPTPTPDLRVEAGQVAEQIKNISKFIYIYGKVVNGFELADEQARTGKMTPAATEQNRKSKEALLANIRNLRGGVEGVAQNFRNNPRLQVQALKLSFAIDAVREAEQLATAGRYDEAGKSFVTVIERLTDIVLAMR